MDRRQFLLATCASAAAWPLQAATGSALVAVAANFSKTAEGLLPAFEAETGYQITLSSGSTGQFYGQITNGAPYDAFLAADQARPALLAQAGLSLNRLTYARGLLVLMHAQGTATEASLQGNFNHLAIANPALAPYGLAAKQALVAMGLWAALKGRIVMGQNVGQAYALVASGNAELGLVARSSVQSGFWPVPEGHYAPILQDAVLLRENPAAAAFLKYLGTDTTQAAIRAAGYGAL
ncbi:MAG TPA: molybdate ABC transporter substrate-binding protein [Rhodobacteraceae bacterium]|nr:molybdate ABC transporter substrate-binding protein [Paracoccaceae bacterium]